jgi:hypothetical protein
MKPISEGTLDEVARLIADGISINKAAAQVGIGGATLYGKIGDKDAIRLWATQRATPEVREQATIRERVAKAIATKGPFESIGELRDAIAQPRELIVFQSIVGAVWSLQKQGEVAITQTSNTHQSNGHGPADGGLKNIRALPSLYRRLGLPEPGKPVAAPVAPPSRPKPEPVAAPVAPEPVAPEPEPVPPVTPEPEPEAFPILAAIRAKAGQARRSREAAKMIEAAAELLPPDERDRLITEALAVIEAHDLTPVEDEYLAFAEANA